MSFWRGAFVLLFIFSVLIIFKGPGDPDFGWHYKYGEYMVEHRTLLRANTFSYTFPDYEWANSYWVSELLLYLTHRYLGSFLAGLLFTLVFVAAVFLFIFALAQKVAASRVVVLFLLLLAFLNFSAYLIPVRPLVFSTIFLMLLTLLFIKVPLTFDRVDKKLFLLIPLFLVWANVHADFVLGLFIVLIYYFAGLLGEFSAARKNYLKTFRNTSFNTAFGCESNAPGGDVLRLGDLLNFANTDTVIADYGVGKTTRHFNPSDSLLRFVADGENPLKGTVTTVPQKFSANIVLKVDWETGTNGFKQWHLDSKATGGKIEMSTYPVIAAVVIDLEKVEGSYDFTLATPEILFTAWFKSSSPYFMKNLNSTYDIVKEGDQYKVSYRYIPR